MITVTPSACAALAELLEDADLQSHIVIRVVASDDGDLELSLEATQIEDMVFHFRGRNVLAVDPTAAQALSGTSLDL